MIILSFIVFSLGIVICSSLMIAYSNANKIYLNLESKKNEEANNYLKIITEQPRLFIGSLKVGNSICITITSFLFFISYFKTYELSDIWIIFIYLILLYLITKFIPQTFAKPFANEIIFIAKPFITIVLSLFGSIAKFFIVKAESVIEKKYPNVKEADFNLLSIGDLGSYISQQIKANSENEQLENEFEILKNALSFPKVKVKEIMTPKNEFDFVNENDSIEIIRKKFIDTGYSKILVTNNTNEHFIGYLHTYDLLELNIPITNHLRPFVYVYDDLLIKDLLNTLTLRKKSIALVKNQEKEIIGLVTLEDIIEELFGEITDEHDDSIISKQISETDFIFSANLDIDDINEKYNLKIPTSETYHSLGGYIFNHINRHPKPREIITINPYRFKILSATNTRIKTISVAILN